MKRWSTVPDSLALLTPTDRRRLGAAAGIQMLTAFLDAAGIALFGIVAAMATAAVSGSAMPDVVERVVSLLGVDSDDLLASAIVLTAVAGLLLVVKSVANVLLTRRVLFFLARRQAIVSSELAADLLSRPLLQVQRRQSQETAFALTNGVNAAMLGVLGQSVTLLTELALLVVLAVGLLVVDPIVALFAVGFFTAIALVLHRIMSSRAQRLGRADSAAGVASTALVQESIATYRELLVSHRRQLYVDRFQALRWQAAQVQADLNLMALVPKYVFEVALIVGTGLLAWSQFVAKDAAAAMATIAVFLAAGSRIVPSMLRLQGASLGIRVAGGMARPTVELARELNETQSSRSSGPSERSAQDLATLAASDHGDFKGRIHVEDVVFAYELNVPPALDQVTLVIEPGRSVALVGPTGAGKSTLADAILGVVQPGSGRVSIDGHPPLDAVSRWPGAMAYVPQNVAMAPGTIRQNVALGLPDEAIDDDRVWESLERARLASFLRTSRDGLDTVVGEAGVKLSGGQRQRLGIARALYTRPKLLVLDEATSALDAETEHAIVDTLRDLEGDVTTVTVAHRLATVRHCDLVIYMEVGRILTQGSFDEVVAAAPNFARQAKLLGLA